MHKSINTNFWEEFQDTYFYSDAPIHTQVEGQNNNHKLIMQFILLFSVQVSTTAHSHNTKIFKIYNFSQTQLFICCQLCIERHVSTVRSHHQAIE